MNKKSKLTAILSLSLFLSFCQNSNQSFASSYIDPSPSTSTSTGADTSTTSDNNEGVDTSNSGKVVGDEVLDTSNADLFKKSEINYFRDADTQGKVVKARTVEEAKKLLPTLNENDIAIVPVLSNVYPYINNISTSDVPNAKPISFYSYRLIKKKGDRYQYELTSRTNGMNSDSEYPMYVPNTINKTYWLDTNGKVAYIGNWQSTSDKIRVEAKGSITLTSGGGTRSSRAWYGYATADQLFNTGVSNAFFKAREFSDLSKIVLKNNSIDKISGNDFSNALINNVSDVLNIDGTTKAEYIPFSEYLSGKAENKVGKYTIYLVDKEGNKVGIDNKPESGKYQVVYELMRVGWENPVSAFSYPLLRAIPLELSSSSSSSGKTVYIPVIDDSFRLIDPLINDNTSDRNDVENNSKENVDVNSKDNKDSSIKDNNNTDNNSVTDTNKGKTNNTPREGNDFGLTKKNEDLPKTNDSSNILLYSALLLSGSIIAFFAGKRIKKDN